MKVEFTVYGEPVGKGRPRFSVNSKRGYVQVHTPEKTVQYENLVRLEYVQQCNVFFQEKKMLKMQVKAYFAIPKSASKKVRKEMEGMVLQPTKKPDADNILKSIADSLNTIAYHDDSQIVSATIEKYYAEKPRAEIVIEEIEK